MKRPARFAIATIATAAFAALGIGTASYAHHAFTAEFDGNAPVILKGKVQLVEWVNPHSWIHITVEDVDHRGKPLVGTTYNWALEGGTPNTLLRTGINRNSLKVGTEIVVRGYQSKDGLCEMHLRTGKRTCKANGRDVTFPSGCKLFMGSSGTGAPRDGSDSSEGGTEQDCKPV